MFEQTVKRTIARHGMLSPGDRVVVAVSGGPDSVCLLAVLRALSAEFGLDLHVAHLDHGFRGEGSAREAAFVRQLAQTLGVPSTIEHADVRRYCAERGVSAQTGAREVRYRFLDRVARETGGTRIALGHTANDQAETVLLRLIRGAGLAGLSGIRPTRGPLIRPLIEATRPEVLAYLRQQGQDFVTDPSNADPAYTRNRVRSELLPVLERFNPRIVETLAAQAELFRDDDLAMDAGLSAVLPAVIRRTDDAVRIDREAFLGLPAGLRKRLLRRAVEKACGCGTALSAVQTGDALEFLRTTRSGRRLDLPCGLGLEREYGAFLLRPRTAGGAFDHPVDLPGTTAIPLLGLSVGTAVSEAGPIAPAEGNYLWQAVFDYDKITLPLHLRNRRPGDSFHPAGMGGRSKKLQDYFVDRKVPRTQRDAVPLLTTQRDILWVMGMRTDGRFLPGPATKKVLMVQVRRTG